MINFYLINEWCCLYAFWPGNSDGNYYNGFDIEFYYCVAGAAIVFKVQKSGRSEAKKEEIHMPETEVKVMVIDG